ncbi:uncharacterized protein LOC124439336 [Xenia sp. Carnegie-2017]|uniref:uncharacterized protein LOC124439336 n=1 Tax=Xenia sp. Carnegie-2017 TaxID=2897299 RepID=UPI001F04266F|nr:uncharacterized protein LOC124439336 [Xenia sp. Carnegie-2017]
MDQSVLKKVKKFLRGKPEKEVGFTAFWEGTKSFYPTDLSKTKVKEWLKEHSDCFQIIKAPNGNPFGKVKLIEKDKGLEVELPSLNANEDFQIKEKLIASIDNEEEKGHLFAIICRDKASIFPAKLQDKKLIRKWLITHDDWFKLVYDENGGLFSVKVLNKARKNKRGGRGLSKTTSPNDAQTKQNNVSCITKKLNALGGTMLLELLFKDLATGNIVKEKSELMTILTDFPSTFEIFDLGENGKWVLLKESFAEPNQSEKVPQSCDHLNKDHVSQIIQFIFQNDGTVSYNKTLEYIKNLISGLPSSDDDILQLLMLTTKFEIIEKPEIPGKPWMVKVKFYSQPRLCQTYVVNGQCSRKNCPFLHICKAFICQQPHNAEQCQLSHDFHDEHNKIIMEKMGEISKESNKTIANVLFKSYFPRVCMEYNKNGNCPRKDKCHFLHVCGDYVLNQCSKSPCSLNHNINGDMHNINLLKKYALLPSKQLPIEIVKANIAYAQVGNINTKLNIPPSPMNVLPQGQAFNMPQRHIPQMPQFFPSHHQRPLAPIFQHQIHFQNNLPHQIPIPPLVQQMNPSFMQRPPPLMEVPTYLGNGARKERAKKNTPEIKSSTLGEEKKHKRNRGARRRKMKGTTTTSSSVDDSGMVDDDISDEESEEFLHEDKESSMLSWENLENSHLSNKMSGFQKVENWMGNSVESTMNKVCNEKDESDSSSSSEISTFSSIPSSAALSQQSQWKGELQKKVFLTILEKFNGNGSFKKILKEKDLFPENIRNIEEWFSKYPRMFILHRNGRGNVDTVTVFSTKARICLDYNGKKGGCYKTNCEYVHICRNYFEGRCNGCNLNHDFASSEVDLVKKRMGFEDLTSEQFSTLVAMSVPSVCHYHNQGNCNRGKFCPNLHVCKKFIQRRRYCREKLCKFGHESSLTDDHAMRILKMYHMFKDQPNIKYLKKMIFVFERERKITNVFKNREDNNVLEDNNADQDNEVKREKTAKVSKKTSNQMKVEDEVISNNESRKKKAMSDVLQPGENLNEREVFVPFLYEDVDNIMNENISASRMMTTTPQPLGRGYYFTSDVTKSLQWCFDNLGDTRSKINLLVCQVLLGESTKGHRYLTEFPRREDGRFFDSLVDNKENPSLFVISNIEQCYPLYVIDFTFPQSSSAHLGSPVQNASYIVGNNAPDVQQTSLPYQQPPPAYEEVPSLSTYSIAPQVQTSLENGEWAKVVPSNPSRNSTHPEPPPQYSLHPQSSSGQQNCNDESVASTLPLVTRRDKKEKDCIVM